MTEFASVGSGADILEAAVSFSEEPEIVAGNVGDSDDDSLGLTELENSIREVAEMEGMVTVFCVYSFGLFCMYP